MSNGKFKRFLKSNYFLYRVSYKLRKLFYMGGVKITNKGRGRFIKDIVGRDNEVIVETDSFVHKPTLVIRGKNNRLYIGKGCSIMHDVGIRIDGNNIVVMIGDNTSIQHGTRLVAQGANINIGSDCMFSNNVFIRTSDSHPIYDNVTGLVINSPKDVVVGNHVWLASRARLFKGAVVGDGSVVGAYSLVTKQIPQNCIVAGMPAKVIKQDVRWERE